MQQATVASSVVNSTHPPPPYNGGAPPDYEETNNKPVSVNTAEPETDATDALCTKCCGYSFLIAVMSLIIYYTVQSIFEYLQNKFPM